MSSVAEVGRDTSEVCKSCSENVMFWKETWWTDSIEEMTSLFLNITRF